LTLAVGVAILRHARHPGESREPFCFSFASERSKAKTRSKWVPAFAGMTIDVELLRAVPNE